MLKQNKYTQTDDIQNDKLSNAEPNDKPTGDVQNNVLLDAEPNNKLSDVEQNDELLNTKLNDKPTSNVQNNKLLNVEQNDKSSNVVQNDNVQNDRQTNAKPGDDVKNSEPDDETIIDEPENYSILYGFNNFMHDIRYFFLLTIILQIFMVITFRLQNCVDKDIPLSEIDKKMPNSKYAFYFIISQLALFSFYCSEDKFKVCVDLCVQVCCLAFGELFVRLFSLFKGTK